MSGFIDGAISPAGNMLLMKVSKEVRGFPFLLGPLGKLTVAVVTGVAGTVTRNAIDDKPLTEGIVEASLWNSAWSYAIPKWLGPQGDGESISNS